MIDEQKRAHADAVALNPWMPERDPIRLAVLGKLLEELGELTAAVSRCLVQGIEEREPVTGKPNRQWLESETADVLAGIDVLVTEFDLDQAAMSGRRQFKQDHVRRWHRLINVDQFQAEKNDLEHRALIRDIVTGDGSQLENLTMSPAELNAVLDDSELPLEITADHMRRALRLLGVRV